MTTGAKYLGIDIKSLNKEVRLNLLRYVKTSIRLEKNGAFWFGKIANLAIVLAPVRWLSRRPTNVISF